MIRICLLVCVLVWIVCGAEPARAEPISTAIGITALISSIGVSTAVAGAVGGFLITTAVSVGLSYLTNALMAPGAEAKQEQPVGGTTGRLQAGGAVPRSFIFGRAMTAGSLVYVNTFGQDGNTPNAYLVQVIALSDLPVTGLVSVLVNGRQVGSGTADTEGTVIPEFTVNGKHHLWVRFHDGAQTDADARLVALFSGDSNRPYSSDRVGVGVAYAVVTALVNEELFRGFPECKFIIDGVPLYDRRQDSTAGGSGAQRANQPETWLFSVNPIVMIENVLRGIRYEGGWLYGAQTVTTAQLPSASWMAAGNECDVAIPLAGGGTEAQFRAGGEIRLDQEPGDAIEELLKACNGKLAEIGGAYKVRAGAAGAAVFAFTDADILSTEQQTFEPFPSLGQTINHVTGKYVSPAENWNVKDAPPLADPALEETDGGRRQSVDVTYGFVTSGTAVQRLMRAERNGHRAFRRHALPMPPDAFVLEPLDVVAWTSERNGYEDKLFDIVSAEDLPNLNVGLAVKEIDPNDYDWDAETDEQPVVDGTITFVAPPPQPIIDPFAEPYTLTGPGGTKRPAIRIGWDPETDDVDGVRWEVRLASNEEVVLAGEGDIHVLLAGSTVLSHNLMVATAYEVRVQYRPHSARPTAWSTWMEVTTGGEIVQGVADGAIDNDALDAELRSRVRQVELQIPQIIRKVRSSLDTLAAAINAHAAVGTEQLGFTRRALGVQSEFAKASITQLEIAIADSEQALAALVTTLATEYTNTTGMNSSIATAKNEAISTAASDATSAIATAIASLSATYETIANSTSRVNTAKAEAISTAAADVDSSIAAYDLSIFASSGGVDASGHLRFIASSAASGALATFAIEVNVGTVGAPDWRKAGIYLDAMSGASRIRLLADQTRIATSGTGAGDLVFETGTVGGVSGTILRAALIGDLAVNTLKIATAAVTVDALEGAVSPGGGFATTSFNNVQSFNINFTANSGSTVRIFAAGAMRFRNTGGSDLYFEWQLLIDGNVVGQGRTFSPSAMNNEGSAVATGTATVTGTGGSQSVSIQLQTRRVGVGTAEAGAWPLLAVAYKR